MANEITASVRLQVNNGGFRIDRRFSNVRADQNEIGGGGPGTVSVGTIEQSIDMTGYGYVLVNNLDPDNFVRIGFSSGVYSVRSRAGGPPLLIELEPNQTIYLVADTAESSVDIVGLYL